ncbi:MULTISPECIES: 4-oxalocrotonate tautomerase family protein [unclassified Sporosarcina]|uniref:tautomerase family protein n=1 Tax=unclassified Sporosarcina TaxID=2647733 RepID=UPI0018EBBB15|nr:MULTISPECIES: 4-oxalocrotonate tautomerase family protein [unclassified Sporosarcina]
MPFVHIKMIEKRCSSEKKEIMIKEVTDLIAGILEQDVETVRVQLEEMRPEDWGIAGESVKKRTEKSLT